MTDETTNAAEAAPIVSEYVVRIDGHPKYSGTKAGANVAVQRALIAAANEGRAEPDVVVSVRTVDYNKSDVDPTKVSEKVVQL
jgi:hypothetical protein